MYNTHPVCSAADTFADTTCEIGEYIAYNYEGAGEFIQAMDPDVLVFNELIDPTTTPT